MLEPEVGTSLVKIQGFSKPEGLAQTRTVVNGQGQARPTGDTRDPDSTNWFWLWQAKTVKCYGCKALPGHPDPSW